jgi:hypothetical protein
MKENFNMDKGVSVVNEDRLLSLIPDFFEKPENVIIEIAQNAVRSGATKLDITLNGNTLIAKDNGKGIDNPKPLFILADSDWTKEVEENHKPAGWGLFYLFSIASVATFNSRFGSVTVNCNRFLKENIYRIAFLNMLDYCLLDGKCEGFYIEAVLKEGVKDKLLNEESLKYFPLNITVNGKLLKKGNVEDIRNFDIKTSYKGNDVYIYLGDLAYREVLKVGALWYGIPIDLYCSDVVIDVKNGSPLTPVLPYRHTVKHDKKYDEFIKFVRRSIVNYCIGVINSKEDDVHEVYKCVSHMVAFATQKELNILDRFVVVKKQPYHDSENIGTTHKSIITKKDIPLISEDVKIKGVGKYDSEDVFLPEGSITAIELPDRRPIWVQVKKIVHVVRIKTKGKPYHGNFQWVKSDIDSPLKIDIVSISQGYDGTDIFYKDKPHDFHDISDVIFDNKYYIDYDSDRYDTQLDYFNQDIDTDISKIENKYDIGVLLKPFSDIGVSPSNVVSISVSSVHKKMVINTNSGQRELGLM